MSVKLIIVALTAMMGGYGCLPNNPATSLRNWKEGNQPFSYDGLIAYLEELGGKDYAEEAGKIIYGTEKIVLPEFG